MTPKAFIARLREGPYTSLGGYPIYFYTHDDKVISFAFARTHVHEVASRVAGAEINWEDRTLTCDESGERIECAYKGEDT